MADSLSAQINAPHDPVWHDNELLTPAGRAAHAARVRALAGNRQARLDLEQRWDPVLKGSSPVPLVGDRVVLDTVTETY